MTPRPALPWLLPILLISTVSLPGCRFTEDVGFQGYVEGEYLYLAAPQAGYLKTLDQPRGSRVASGQRVFSLTADPDDWSLAEAEARVDAARYKLRNLKEPRRPPEIAALEADQHAAEAALKLAQIQLQQQESLFRQRFVPQAKVDEARSARDQAAAQVEAAKQRIATYQVTLGREAELGGAEAELEAASALAAQKRWILDHKTLTAPTEGEIVDTYYRPGEWVPAGAAVASLLPDHRRRVRFFVPETVVATVRSGDTISATCDGCASPILARIDFIAARAEYTPPVIYSRGTREKLVFRVEAAPLPDQATHLHPGLPVDVSLAP